MKLPPSKMDGLLEMVGKKLGVSPEQLRSDLESGKLEQAMQNLSKKEAANVQNLLKDQKKVEQLRNTPQAKALYEKLMGK